MEVSVAKLARELTNIATKALEVRYAKILGTTMASVLLW